MAYSIQWGQKSPGHIIFLIDQSGSMSGDNEIKAAEAVHKAIEEIINNCINGTKVKNRVYITIIGYGNENDVCILKEGWATDYVMDLQKCKSNGTLIVEPDSYGGTPMAEGFDISIIKDDFLDFIAKFKNETLPKIMDLYQKYKDKKQFVILHNYKEVDEFLNNLKPE